MTKKKRTCIPLLRIFIIYHCYSYYYYFCNHPPPLNNWDSIWHFRKKSTFPLPFYQFTLLLFYFILLLLLLLVFTVIILIYIFFHPFFSFLQFYTRLYPIIGTKFPCMYYEYQWDYFFTVLNYYPLSFTMFFFSWQ